MERKPLPWDAWNCTCPKCDVLMRQKWAKAREEWNQGRHDIKFKEYEDDCWAGQHVYINDFMVVYDTDTNLENVLEAIADFFEVKINMEFVSDDYNEIQYQEDV